jgi:hypothetical protein
MREVDNGDEKANRETSEGVQDDIERSNEEDEFALEEALASEEDLLPTDKVSFFHKFCYAHRITWQEAAPFTTCLIAVGLTGAGSWHCSYFNGASISFTGNDYGLWTLEDISGKCQLWDVLFFAYDLGAPLMAARVFSMAAMLVGLSLLTTMVQAARMHVVSWGIGVWFFILFMISVTTSSLFNIWIVFFFFSYVILILINRALFIHPVHRVISARGNKIIAGTCFLCFACSLLTLVVLKSDFCTCANISSETLEGRDPGDPCAGGCSLGAAGYLTVVAAVFWLCSAVAVWKFGVTPLSVRLDIRPDERYAHYPKASIVTRVIVAKKQATNAPKRVLKNLRNNPFSGVTEQSSTPASQSTSMMKGDNDETQAADVERNNEDDSGDASDTDLRKSLENDISEVPPVQQARFDGVNEGPDKRSCCQKWCCDYKVTDRSRKEKWAFWSFRVALGILVVIYVFLIILLIGSRGENTTAAKEPDTSCESKKQLERL